MKRLRVILLFLLLGALVNVGVAWGCAVVVNASRAETETIMFNVRYGDQVHISSTGQVKWLWKVELRRGFGTVEVASTESFYTHKSYAKYDADESGAVLPAWATVAQPVVASYIEVVIMHSIGRGWPCVSLVHDEIQRLSQPVRSLPITIEEPTGIDRGIELTRWQWPATWGVRRPPHVRVLPLRPAWRGFTVNTAFYAGLLWLPLVARRMIRRKRGLCVTCAYDLRGAEHEACPECGQKCLSS